MKVTVTAIRDAGNLDKERVVCKVSGKLNIGRYLMLQTKYKGGTLYGRVYLTHWFDNTDVDTGDFVVLYTKSGTTTQKDFNGAKSHFFYMGLQAPIWTKKEVTAVVLYASEWSTLDNEAPEESP